MRSSRLRIERWRAGVICVRRIEERRVFREVREGLMVELEYDVRIVCRLRVVLERHVPAARVPFPANPGVIESVTDALDIARLRGIGVIDQQTPGRISRARREWRLCGLNCVHTVLTVERELIVMQRLGRWIIAGLAAGRDRRGPWRTLRRNQPLVIEERTAVRRVEKIVAECELLRQLAFRQIRRIEIGKDEAGIIAPGHELAEIALF